MILFIDSDVILDSLLQREPFNVYSSLVLDLSKKKSAYQLVTTSICIANITYMLSKSVNKAEASTILTLLLSGIDIIHVSKQSIQNALQSDFTDIEDAYQYFACKENSVDLIITRNKRDYELSSIPVVSPVEFIQS